MKVLILAGAALFAVSCAGRRVPIPAEPLQATPGFLDLRPGVRVTVERAYYEGAVSGKGLNGFLGTRLATWAVRPNGNLQLASQESKRFRDGAQIPGDQFVPAAMRNKRRYRIVYAVTFQRGSQPSASVLLGGKSAKEIEALAAQLKASPDRLCTPQSAQCTVFPENSTVSIAMDITVNGLPKVVLWGSALGSVTGGRPAASLERLQSGRLEQVQLNGDALRIPLLPMDQVKF